jgi:hypothetical protein
MNFKKIFEKSFSPEENKEKATPLDNFQKEIEGIKEEEAESGIVMLASTKNVPEVKPQELIEEDMEIWNKFKEGELELEELEEYRSNIDPDNYHRRAFSNFVIKKLLEKEKGSEEIKEV